MTKRFISVLFLGFMVLNVVSPQVVSDDKTWEEKPASSSIKSEFENENVVGIYTEEKFNFYYDENGDLMLKHLLHRRLRLNNDEAINTFNKLSVSLANVLEVLELKARVIKPNGSVIEFDKNNIKDITDEESGDNYKIFAIDGIEKGDDIEYLIVRKMKGDNFGRTYYQFSYPLQMASFELTSPKNLKYAIKGYNGFPSPDLSELEDGNRYTCSLENIPGLKEEEYNYFNPRRARIEFKLEYNLSRSKAKVLTWNDASQRIYSIMYQDVEPRSIEKWMSTMKIKDGTPLSKAAQVEEYIKSNIHIEDLPSPELNDLDYIRTRKVTSEQGIVRLYANVLKALGVKHDIVLTSERDEIKFDPDFMSWNYLSKYLIYLPDDNTYIDPSEDSYRIGCVSGELTATYGLFIELVKIGEFESSVGKIRYINPTPYQANYDNMNIEISVNVDKSEIKISDTRGLKGLSGGYIGRIYKTLDEERKQEVLKSIMESKASNPDYAVLKVQDKSDVDFIRDADFIIYSEFTTSNLLEIAGNKLLLNIGESIGPQVELYHDKDIMRGGESEFNRWYYRRITVKVPDGYRIVNPEATDMNITEKSGDEITFGFISTHEYNGSTYVVNIDETYKKIFIEPEEFEGFRNVVNAAANFNKVVLVLEKI